MTHDDTISILDDILEWPDNWDYNGASSFTVEHIAFIKDIIRPLPVAPEVFPTMRKSLQIEYKDCANKYLEFEIYSNGRIVLYEEFIDGSYEECDIKSSEVSERVKRFYNL